MTDLPNSKDLSKAIIDLKNQVNEEKVSEIIKVFQNIAILLVILFVIVQVVMIYV